jgi:hypothetical protein
MKSTDPIPARRGRRPWAHSPNPDNPSQILPDAKAIELLNKAFDFLDRDHPFRAVAEWLSNKSGIRIGSSTLFRLYQARLESLPRLARKT